MGGMDMHAGHIIAMCALAGLIVGAQAAAEGLPLVKNGKSDYTIVLSKEASPSEEHAAEELQNFLFEISGAKLPIEIEGDTVPARMIVLGDGETRRLRGTPIDIRALGDEGYTIRTFGPDLIIVGGRLRGTMYGVYTFLEKVLGCRWYSPTVSYIPKQRTIILPRLDITETPSFEYREPFYSGAFDADWAARNKCNGNHAKLDDTRGGKVSYGRFVHTFAELIPPAKYFKDHPEYFSLVDGKRQDGYAQICMTNPEVLKIATDGVMKWIADDPKATIFSVSQNDTYKNCQCDACRAVDAEEGSPSGLMLRFVNAIADEVAKKHPNVLIDTLAYQWTEKPPKITKPRPNVRVRLCPISNCQHHPYERCEQNAGFMDNIRNWSNITDCLYIWHYNTVFPNYLLPLPDLDELKADVPMYKRFGVKGMFMQGTYNAGWGPDGGAGFMDDLKAYMLAKTLWDEGADVNLVIADFLVGFYGKAAEPIHDWLKAMHKKVRDENLHGNIWANEGAGHLSPEILAKGEECFDRAEKLAENPGVLARVKHARLSLEYVKVMREAKRAGEKGTPEEKAAALGWLTDFRDRCKADGITQWSEWQPMDANFDALAAPLRK